MATGSPHSGIPGFVSSFFRTTAFRLVRRGCGGRWGRRGSSSYASGVFTVNGAGGGQLNKRKQPTLFILSIRHGLGTAASWRDW